MSGEQSRIAFAVPYFGKLPNYFQLWLISCRYNPTVEWYLFTDDQTKYDYPKNVHVLYESFEEMKERVQRCFDFTIALDRPYKLCDFKPSYGEVFAQYLQKYDFWGCCDIDLMFGDIRTFVTEEILAKHDKVFSLSHFTLYRNTKKINTLYRDSINGEPTYQKVFTMAKYVGFDERGPLTIQEIFRNNTIEVYDEILFADIKIEKYHFELTHSKKDPDEQRRECSLFTFQHGRLVRLFLEHDKMCEKEYLYIHLQKRSMKIELSGPHPDRLIIIPNRFIDFMDGISCKELKRFGRYKGIYYRNAWPVIRDKVKDFIAENVARRIPQLIK